MILSQQRKAKGFVINASEKKERGAQINRAERNHLMNEQKSTMLLMKRLMPMTSIKEIITGVYHVVARSLSLIHIDRIRQLLTM